MNAVLVWISGMSVGAGVVMLGDWLCLEHSLAEWWHGVLAILNGMIGLAIHAVGYFFNHDHEMRVQEVIRYRPDKE